MITLIRMPPHPDSERILYYEEKTFTVEWYCTEKGEFPGLEYYEAMSPTDQERLDYMVKHIADSPIGTKLPETMYRIEDRDHKIYAFKPRNERFFNFTTEGRKIIITNAYHKHSQKMSKDDLKKLATSVNYRKDYLKRVREKTYYENQS